MYPRATQNRHNAPTKRSPRFASFRSFVRERAALKLSRSASSRASHSASSSSSSRNNSGSASSASARKYSACRILISCASPLSSELLPTVLPNELKHPVANPAHVVGLRPVTSDLSTSPERRSATARTSTLSPATTSSAASRSTRLRRRRASQRPFLRSWRGARSSSPTSL